MSEFRGFSPKAVSFLRALKRNNERTWFEKHRAEYEEYLLHPSRAFIESLREPLHRMSPHLQVGPKSMYRIYRDTRFSEDKTPYKTWVGYHFQDTRGGDKVNAPFFYLGWDPSGIAYGSGVWQFTPQQREIFRTRVTEGHSADRFTQIVAKLKRGKRFEVRGASLKRMPKGYDPDHINAPFLLHSGAYTSYEEDFPRDFYTPRFTARAVKLFQEALPFLQWMDELRAR